MRGFLRKRTSRSNARAVSIIGIPLVSLLMPFIMLEPSDFGSRRFFYTLLFTIAVTVGIWEGNAFIVRRIKRKLKWETTPLRRLVAQAGLTLSFSLFIFLLINWVFTPILNSVELGRNHLGIDLLGVSILTLLMNAIYESIYFSRRWRFSVMRAEVLKRSTLRAQYESLKNQVNPHFLFNSLNTLTTLIEEDSEDAVLFVQSLASAYRYLLQNKDYKLVRLIEELKFTQTYVFLLKTRFGSSLDVQFDISIEDLQKSVPPLCMQILVENAVKHNIMSREKPLHILITVIDGNLRVSNNLQLKPILEEYAKLGIKNIRDRYKELSRKPVEIKQDAQQFTVQLPLISN